MGTASISPQSLAYRYARQCKFSQITPDLELLSSGSSLNNSLGTTVGSSFLFEFRINMAVPKYVATSSFETPASLPTDKLLHNNIHRTTGPSYDTPEDISRTGSVSTPHIPLKAPQEPAKFVRWGIHWQVPTQMVSLLVAGVALAAGHHVYYQSLVGTKVLPVDDTVSAWNTGRQEWKIRFGTAFAFFAKTCLASSIAIAYTQHIWATCRRKAYSISGLDAMFSATSDVSAFTSPDLTLRAKVGALLAALIW
jgi:hypothetical protein